MTFFFLLLLTLIIISEQWRPPLLLQRGPGPEQNSRFTTAKVNSGLLPDALITGTPDEESLSLSAEWTTHD